MFMNKRILVTGANGFLGSNIINELLANKTPVTALVREKSNIDYLKSIKCYGLYVGCALARARLAIVKPQVDQYALCML